MNSVKETGCRLCPRQCGADRAHGAKGICGSTDTVRVARAALHMWEEPCISGEAGSGAVFFAGCPLHCIFCQNRAISGGDAGKEVSKERLSQIFLELQAQGAANVNLVTAGHHAFFVSEALREAKRQGLAIPVVWNSGGYESVETLERIADVVDIWLPDMKYRYAETAAAFSRAADYPEVAERIVAFMVKAAGKPVFDEKGYMKRGVIVRHLVLPGHAEEAKEIVGYLYRTYKDDIYLSILNQYTPPKEKLPYPELNRRLTTYEYNKVVDFALSLGVENAFVQERSAAGEDYVPAFNGEGV
ncbi:MAG: radical SAM protein [Lachnospiraceae bacterium]|nr:radical SAM protein [Lachnospiraceae bacterium]